MPAKEDEVAARSFATFIHHLADGDANRELSEELHKLSQELQKDAYNRNAVSKGTLKVGFKLSIDPRGQVTIGWDVETREPKPPRVGGVMWIDKKGNLVHENPRQQKLPLREVGGREPDAFDPETGEVRAAREV
jgi:hypothetical protein